MFIDQLLSWMRRHVWQIVFNLLPTTFFFVLFPLFLISVRGTSKFQSRFLICYSFEFGCYSFGYCFFFILNNLQSTQPYETCGFGIIPELHSFQKQGLLCFLINFEESRTHHGVIILKSLALITV